MTPVLLDLDLAMGAPGSDIDDGFALALAVADPEIDLRLVTTVSGNTDAATATALTLRAARPARRHRRPGAPGRDSGAAPPAKPVRPAAGGHPLPAPPGPGTASSPSSRRCSAAPGELTLVAVGPLTNVALAMLLEPAFAGALGDLVIMGGVFAGTTGSADLPGEFNVWSDPEAARIVLQSGVMATWVGLDVTCRVRLDPRRGGARWPPIRTRSPHSPGATPRPGSTTWRRPPSRA